MFLLTNKARNKCNTSFSDAFDCKIHFWFCDLQSSLRQKVNFKVKRSILRSSQAKVCFLTNKARNKCKTSFSCDFD